jgi:hypothetical protein
MSQETFEKSNRIKESMKKMMETPEGKAMGEKIRNKLKELNDQFKGLSGENKKKFADEFKGKFMETFDDLKDSLKVKFEENSDDIMNVESDEPESEKFSEPLNVVPQPNYALFLIALLIILVVIGIMENV